MLLVELLELGSGKQGVGEPPEGLIASKGVSCLTGRLSGQLQLHHVQQAVNHERLSQNPNGFLIIDDQNPLHLVKVAAACYFLRFVG